MSASASAGEGTTAVFWVSVPKNTSLRSSSEALVGAAERVFSRSSKLVFSRPERAGVELGQLDSCDPAARYACWSAVFRGAVAPAPRYLFALAVQPGRPADTLSLVVLDLEQGARRAARIPENTPDRIELLESELYAGAARFGPVQVDSKNRAILERWFATVAGALGPMLKQNGDDRPLGRILVSAAPRNWPVTLDGQTVASTSSAAVLLTEVAAGKREVALLLPDGEKVAQIVEVLSSRTATVGFGLDPGAAKAQENNTLKYGLVFGGVVSFSLGTIVLATSTARAGNIRQVCLVRGGEGGACADAGVVTFGHRGEEAPSFSPETINPRGILMAPLAIGLIGAGALLAGGALWLEELEHRWWWPVVAGIGLTAASYGLGVVLDPR